MAVGPGGSVGGMLRQHIRSNLIGYVALFFALGLGTAWASHLEVLSSDIVDGEVKSQDLGFNSVRSGKVLDNDLTGNDIDESSLATVPNADKLGNRTASTYLAADGLSASQIVAAGTSETVVSIFATGGSFALHYTCPSNPGSTNGTVFFVNGTPGTANLFIDYGASNPAFAQLDPENGIDPDYVKATSPGGEHIQFFFDPPGIPHVLVEVFSRHASGQCSVWATAIRLKDSSF